MRIKLGNKENIHFIGIGGIGMSGLAIVMKGIGFKIQGSDLSSSKNLDRLKNNRIKVFLGHKKKNISNSTIIVISSAIKKNNPELVEAKKKKLPIYKRGEMLGHVVSLMKNIVIAGSHGKTTTTSLVSSIFSYSKIDPTIINGGVLNSYGNSAKLGKSNWCILESDESDGSFLNIPITYSVVTNIDKEHLDYHKSLDNLKDSFVKFLNKTPSFGKSFICIDDPIIKSISKKIKNKNFLTYGLEKNANFRIKNVIYKKEYSLFDLIISLPGQKINYIKKLQSPIIGLHNVRNAAASAAVCYLIGIPDDMIKSGLKNFQGVQRRFNKLFTYRKINFIDDYAHHPSEISSVLTSIREVYKYKEIVCIFQPHRVSRLNYLKKEFTKCFRNSDYLVLCPVFKAGENIKINFNYENFAKEVIKNSKVNLITINDEKDILNYVKQNIFGNKIVIGMGAGSISNWLRSLEHKLK